MDREWHSFSQCCLLFFCYFSLVSSFFVVELMEKVCANAFFQFSIIRAIAPQAGGYNAAWRWIDRLIDAAATANRENQSLWCIALTWRMSLFFSFFSLLLAAAASRVTDFFLLHTIVLCGSVCDLRAPNESEMVHTHFTVHLVCNFFS